ncbi:hypothetical protein [Wenzhouxiangella sp. EGI_FJ10409]|uniref:hypothetical protein n=1 Tax=Wenzhouxiangella sp. EGI_FJ10409 TaxID=3243767 RepID=UPI0035DF5530
MLIDPGLNGPARVCLLALLGVMSLSACGDRSGSPGEESTGESASGAATAESERGRQTAFRVREDFEAELNSGAGWAGDVNVAASVVADRPFRLRFEVESTDEASASRQYRLEVRRNGGEWAPLPAENFPQPEKLHELDLAGLADDSSDPLWRFEHGGAESMSLHTEAGEAHLRLETGDEPMLALGRYEVPWRPREFAVELRLSEEESARAGLIFDYRGIEDHSRIEVVAPDTVRVVRVEGGRSVVVAEHQADIDAGRWMELKTIIDGRELVVEFDDEALVFSETLETDDPAPKLGLHLPERSAADIRAIAIEGQPHTPRTSIIASETFDHGAPTQDVLSVSEQPFSGGAGVSFSERTPPWHADGGHGEWEFPIVIRRFSDHAALNEAGDRFDYRLVGSDGRELAAEATASVSLEVPDGHLGGTFVETPMRIGPWQADNGDLYFLMEPAETWNALMAVRSSDGGDSWREVDGENRPKTGDLEGFGSLLVDDRIHMLHQTSDEVVYHVFNTADHPEAPNSWAIRDELVAAPPEPPTQVADIAVRSDGSVVAVYGGPDKIRLRVRSPGGQWGEERVIDADTDPVLSGPTIVRGGSDVIHLAYTADDGSAWYRRILPDGELSERVQVAANLGTASEDIGSILPLLYLPQSESVSVIYRTRDGRLHERRVEADGTWSDPLVISERVVAQNTVDADQVGADAVVNGDTVHVLFIEDRTGRLFHASRSDGAWGDGDLLVDGENVQWVRGAVLEMAGNGRVYGFVYDAGSDGGSGMNRYGQLTLETP